MKKLSENKTASLSIMAAAALWGCIGLFFRVLTALGLDSMRAVTVRVILSALLYTLYLALTDRAALRIRLRDIWMFIGSGVVSLVCFNWCYFNTISISGSMGVAAVLLYTAPVFVMLMSALFFHEKLTPLKLVALGLTFCGCVLVTGVLSGGGSLSPAAVLFGLGSGLGYALYSIFGVLALRRYTSKTVTAYSFIFGALALLPFIRIGDMSVLLCPRGIFASLGIAVFCCILPYILYTAGLEHTEPGKASMLATLEPVVAAVLGVLVYRDSVTLSLVCGIVLVVGAIILLSRGKSVS